MAKSSKKIDLKRRKFLLAATSATGAVGVCALGVPFVSSMSPSEKAKAAGAPVEFDVTQVSNGELKTAEWRGQPVWILNRTKKMLSNLKKSSGGILIKFPKKKQDLRMDLPTVGLNTFKDCKKFGLKGIVLKSKKNIFLDKHKCINFANRNRVFIKVI